MLVGQERAAVANIMLDADTARRENPPDHFGAVDPCGFAGDRGANGSAPREMLREFLFRRDQGVMHGSSDFDRLLRRRHEVTRWMSSSLRRLRTWRRTPAARIEGTGVKTECAVVVSA